MFKFKAAMCVPLAGRGVRCIIRPLGRHGSLSPAVTMQTFYFPIRPHSTQAFDIILQLIWPYGLEQ